MSSQPVVSNSSPLIAFEQLGRLELLHELVGTVLIPTAVRREIAAVSLPEWIEVRALTQPIASIVLRASLGPGESEAISLATEVNSRLLLLDDLAARRLALGLHLPIIGVLGLLLTAKRKGLLEAVKPCLDQLLSQDFRVSTDLYGQVLRDAGEAPESTDS